MRLAIEGLEKERDFFFGKLRDIEVVTQQSADAADPIAPKVLKAIYAGQCRGGWIGQEMAAQREKLTAEVSIVQPVPVSLFQVP